MEWSEPKLWRIESGQTALRALDVQAMCAAYDAPPDLTWALAELARQTRAHGWWRAYGQAVPRSKLYQALGIKILYKHDTHQVTCRATLTTSTPGTVAAIIEREHRPSPHQPGRLLGLCPAHPRGCNLNINKWRGSCVTVEDAGSPGRPSPVLAFPSRR